MALTIYGSPRSRTMRVLWMAAELGLDYEHIPLEWSDPALKAPDFLRLNPAGQVPVIVDDGFALSESLAINLYLAKQYGPTPFYPDTVEGEAEVWRWTLWAQGALEPWVQRDARMGLLKRVAQTHLDELAQAAFEVIERVVKDRGWLCGDEFTVADLNVAAVLSPSRASSFDFARWPHVRDWLTRCYARPAAILTRDRFS